jgi:4-amino-4-deoxy-L-arabinose transferase-like glycosyltransferase
MFAMSDVPVAAWWTLAFAALLRPGWKAALAAGLAGSAAILTRPNLVHLAAAPGALLLWYAARERPLLGAAWTRLLSFVAGVVPGCIAVAVINYWLYDSPLMSGYGDLDQYYSRSNIPVNARLYPRWILQTETALILLAFVAPLVARQRLRSGETGRSVGWMWIALVLATIGSLLPYLIFDHWFYLRLVLSVFPVLLVLMVFVFTKAASPLASALQTLVMVVIVGALTWRGAEMAYRNGAFVFREGERKSQAMGEYVARALPANAALISMQHSGTMRYYSGRLTVRWDFIASASELEPILDTLRNMGYRPYILLEYWEVPLFKERFGTTAVGSLDWPPRAKLEHASRILLWDPDDRLAAAAGRPVRTDFVY